MITDFTGTGKRLTQGDMGDAARALGVETEVLLAFTEVEAAGRGFDSSNRPKMLFEPHVFYRELGNTQKRATAVTRGLAYAKWKAGSYPKDSYPRITAAQAISAPEALRSASWGLSQIMGNNHLDCGHSSVEDMVRTAMQGEREQLLQMVTLMRKWGMVPMLTGKDFTKADSWRQAAAKWNGSGYATHDYHGRMAAAYRKHKGGAPLIANGAAVLRSGMKGEDVRNWQVDLQSVGYVFDTGIDGRFGPETERHTKDFQRIQKLSADGRVGPATRAAMEGQLAAQKEDFTPPIPGKVVAVGALTSLLDTLISFLKGR